MANQPVSVDLSGPFFEGNPGETMIKNLQKMMEAYAKEGEATARASFQSGSGGRSLVSTTTRRVADYVVGRTVSLSGRRWVAAAVVQVSNQGLNALTSRSLMAAGSYVARQTGAISSLTRNVDSARALQAANLTAGLE